MRVPLPVLDLPEGLTDPSRTSLKVPLPVPDLPVGFPTRPGFPIGPRPVPDLPEVPPTRLSPPGESTDPSQPCPRVSRLVPDFPEGFPTHPGPPQGFY